MPDIFNTIGNDSRGTTSESKIQNGDIFDQIPNLDAPKEEWRSFYEKNTVESKIQNGDIFDQIPNLDAPKEEWRSFYEKNTVPELNWKDYYNKELISPIKSALSLRAYDLPKASLYALAQTQGLDPKQVLSQEYPEQNTFEGKTLRMLASIPAVMSGGIPLWMGKGMADVAAAGGAKLGPMIPKGLKTLGNIAGSSVEGAAGAVGAAAPYMPSQAVMGGGDEVSKNIGIAGLVGASLGGVRPPLRFVGNIANKLGEWIQNSSVGKAVADRAREVGWDTLFQNIKEIPQDLIDRGTAFFKNASQAVGKRVDSAVKNPALADIRIPKYGVVDEVGRGEFNGIMDRIGQIYGKGQSLEGADMTPNQRKVLINFIEKIKASNKGENSLSLKDLWDLRKQLDTLSGWNNLKSKQDAYNYFLKIRSILNKPLLEHPGISESFSKYSSIKDAEDLIGSKFEGATGPSGETYSSPVEAFAASLYSGSPKSQMVGLIRDIERELPKNQRVIDDLLNYSAGQRIKSLSDNPNLSDKVSLFSKMLGGPGNVAEMSRGMEDIGLRLRGNPTYNAMSDLVAPKQR